MRELVSEKDTEITEDDKYLTERVKGFLKQVWALFLVPGIFIELLYGIAHPVLGVLFLIIDASLIVFAVIHLVKKRKQKRLDARKVYETISMEKVETNSLDKRYEHMDVEYPDCVDGSWIAKYEYRELKINPDHTVNADNIVVGQSITFNIEEKETKEGYIDYYLVLSQFDAPIAKLPVLKERVAAMVKNYIGKEDWKIQGNISTNNEGVLYYHIVFYENVGANEALKTKTSGTVIRLEGTFDDVRIRKGMKVRAMTLFGGGQMLVTDLMDNKIGFIGVEDTQLIMDAEHGRQIIGVIEQAVVNNLGSLVTVRFNLECQKE